MQVAANPFSAHLPHSHYHAYYQLPPPGPQDHDLKRQYLALLPPQQIIEICLTFDVHVPPYVKSSIWPPDISAAIAGLQKAAEPQPEARPAEELLKDGEPIMNSLKSPLQTDSSSTTKQNGPATEPQPPDREDVTSPVPSTTPVAAPESSTATPPDPTPQANENAPSQPPASEEAADPSEIAQPANPAAQSAAPQPAPAPQAPPHPQYPAAYAYGHPQAAYPHTPYYAGGYSYPYASYPPIQPTYHPPPPPAPYPPQPPMYQNMAPAQQPAQQEGAAADDLPSYEEMIVEALTGCGDPEGWVPKDLFAWMASRYPLQSNFRPSASQALQKAFKRGRFEKSSNGKYRLNATWNGGNTSRRTTRRPQTQNSQSTTNSAPTAPPFTNTPLVHHHHPSTASTHPSTATTSQQTYQPIPYGYSYPPVGYPGYPAQQPQASTSSAPGTSEAASNAVTATAEGAAPAGSDTDTDAAYKAAQDILSAINFSDLYQTAGDDTGDAATGNTGETRQAGALGNGVEELLSHVQAMLASAENNPSGGFVNAIAVPLPPVPSPDPTADPRAALQAQLALLAAQLAELAKIEEASDLAAQQQQQQQQQQQPSASIPMPPPPAPMAVFAPPPPAADGPHPPSSTPAPTPLPIQAPMPITPVSSSLPDPDPSELATPEPMLEEEEESDDDDMEEVI